MTAWCRLHQDMPNDPKWRVVARRSGRPISEVLAVFVHMMVNVTERHANASERSANTSARGELVGWDDEDIAIALDTEREHVAAIRDAMQGKTLDGNRLSGWERRQPLREDGSAERAKAWREEQRAKKEAEKAVKTEPKRDPTEPQTHANAAERKRTPEAEAEAEADIEADIEARQASSVAHPAPEPQPAEPAFDLRSFESLCLDTLADTEPPKGSFAPMAALLGPDVDPDRIVGLVRAELARGRKAVGSWKLWAQICAERITEGPKGLSVPAKPAPVWTGPKVRTPTFGMLHSDFLEAEWRAGRWKAGYGAEPGKPGCPIEIAGLTMIAGRQWREVEIERAVAQFRTSGDWPKGLGPPPGAPGCIIPVRFLQPKAA